LCYAPVQLLLPVEPVSSSQHRRYPLQIRRNIHDENYNSCNLGPERRHGDCDCDRDGDHRSSTIVENYERHYHGVMSYRTESSRVLRDTVRSLKSDCRGIFPATRQVALIIRVDYIHNNQTTFV